ncbi:MAG: cation transporting ATPase C-terminal domain-containing protein [Bacteriovoracaceae bacterium]
MTPDQFRTAWFIESAISEILVLFVIRTARPLFKSRPSKSLIGASLGVIMLTLLAPLILQNKIFEFHPLPLSIYGTLFMVLLSYLVTAEIFKIWFYSKWKI